MCYYVTLDKTELLLFLKIISQPKHTAASQKRCLVEIEHVKHMFELTHKKIILVQDGY